MEGHAFLTTEVVLSSETSDGLSPGYRPSLNCFSHFQCPTGTNRASPRGSSDLPKWGKQKAISVGFPEHPHFSSILVNQAFISMCSVPPSLGQMPIWYYRHIRQLRFILPFWFLNALNCILYSVFGLESVLTSPELPLGSGCIPNYDWLTQEWISPPEPL